MRVGRGKQGDGKKWEEVEIVEIVGRGREEV